MKTKDLTNIDKLKVLFIDYFFIFFMTFTLGDFLKSSLGDNWINPWLFRLLMYFLCIFLPELCLNRTFGMFFLGVSIRKKKNTLSFPFVKYSILVFLDRYLFILIYIFRVLLFSTANLLFSEKYSGLKWERRNIN